MRNLSKTCAFALMTVLAWAQADDWGRIMTTADVPTYPQEVLAARGDGHVEVQFNIQDGHPVNAQLVGPSVSPGLTTLRAAALANMNTWRFNSYASYPNRPAKLMARFDYKLPEKCGLPWNFSADSGGEVQITPELPCPGSSTAYRRILHFENLTYPPIANTARIQGVVKATITIDEKGLVTDVSSVEGHPILRDATIASLKGLRFAPAPGGSTTLTFYFRYRLGGEEREPDFKVVIAPDSIELTVGPTLVETEESH